MIVLDDQGTPMQEVQQAVLLHLAAMQNFQHPPQPLVLQHVAIAYSVQIVHNCECF